MDVGKEDSKVLKIILTDILSGNTLLLLESCPKAIILSTKKYPSRGVGETQQEMVIRGPKDSFTENMRINTALIRRRIRDSRLKMEHTMVGERSKTDLAIVYMDDLVQPELLEKVRQKVNALSFDGIFRWRNGRAAFRRKCMDTISTISTYRTAG